MKKKILLLTLILLAIPILTIIPVEAAPKEKLYFKLYMEGYSDYGVFHSSPKKALGMDYPVQKTFHNKEGPVTIIYANITIGTEEFDTADGDFMVDSLVYYNVIWKTMTVTHKAKDWITFEDGITLEIMVIDILDGLTMTSEGSMVGHGIIDGQKVKIKGITYAAPLPSGLMGITREGTIMVWS